MRIANLYSGCFDIYHMLHDHTLYTEQLNRITSLEFQLGNLPRLLNTEKMAS
jgi:hypothetical protein